MGERIGRCIDSVQLSVRAERFPVDEFRHIRHLTLSKRMRQGALLGLALRCAKRYQWGIPL